MRMSLPHLITHYVPPNPFDLMTTPASDTITRQATRTPNPLRGSRCRKPFSPIVDAGAHLGQAVPLLQHERVQGHLLTVDLILQYGDQIAASDQLKGQQVHHPPDTHAVPHHGQCQHDVVAASMAPSEQSAIQRERDCFSPEQAAHLLARRLAFVNVWRSIGASAERFPLAAADGRSIPLTDYVAVDMVYANRTGEIYHNRYSSGQRWFYFSDMQTDEAMLLKCFDSATDDRTRYTAHTGFANPRAAAGTPPRQSIEVRTILSFAE